MFHTTSPAQSDPAQCAQRCARWFEVNGGTYSMREMAEENAEDQELLDWMHTAAVGERFPSGMGEPVRRVICAALIALFLGVLCHVDTASAHEGPDHRHPTPPTKEASRHDHA